MKLLKRLYWDLQSKDTRALYVEAFLRGVPAQFGERLREKWYRKQFKKCGINLTVPLGAHIVNPQNIECGDNVFFGLYCYIQAGGGLTLGSDLAIGPHVKIWTQNHRFDDLDTPIWQQGYENKPVEIGSDVWIGANAFIMPGAVIGDQCIISAHSVVGAKNYPPRTILAGHPARKVGERKRILDSQFSNGE
jgi:acetyltransferase-like isoleucine patch superfamily enzyme